MSVKHDPWCDALLVTAVAVTVGTGCNGVVLPNTPTDWQRLHAWHVAGRNGRRASESVRVGEALKPATPRLVDPCERHQLSTGSLQTTRWPLPRLLAE